MVWVRERTYRPSDRRLSAKWLPTFADKGCHEVSVTDPYGRILGFLDRNRYFSISSSSVVLTRLSGPRSVPTTFLIKYIWIWTWQHIETEAESSCVCKLAQQHLQLRTHLFNEDKPTQQSLMTDKNHTSILQNTTKSATWHAFDRNAVSTVTLTRCYVLPLNILNFFIYIISLLYSFWDTNYLKISIDFSLQKQLQHYY
jgi:hypothetical protein